ncbi:hypothetical protein KUTeg_020155 [Tegillarca granosa]|uniref:Apextrin C-terminal domain-containing protein n=1 Tax=Tegillarca granosa TaxID=220873 RepID=A0ABQ9ED16_TEGGR|nr:hypothetical protein KUTeg_020155 [Tegillarca granosa]
MWPSGQYALPASMFGCPETELYGWTPSFVNLSLPATSREQIWHDKDPLTFEPHILGPFYKRTFQFNFCTKEFDMDRKENADVWGPGKYCIYRVNTCRDDFQEGNITITGYSVFNRAGNHQTAVLTDNSSVIIHFCCRDDGDEKVEIRLPNTFPFQLFKGHSARMCQKVEGMDVKEDTFFMVNEHLNWKFNPPHPYFNTSNDRHIGIPFCYYYPSISH